MEIFEILYAETHEWLGCIENSELGYIGVSGFALKQLTDVVYLELPAVGDLISKGESFGVLESVNAVSDLYAPSSGEVVEINQFAVNDLESLTDNDPWLIKIRLKNLDVSHLMTQGQYKKNE